MNPLVLQLFGCSGSGLETPLEFDPFAVDTSVSGNVNYLSDSMPLIKVPEETTKSLQQLIEQDYEPQLVHIGFVESSQVASRLLANGPGQVNFAEYWVTHDSTDAQPVYALTTGHLFFLSYGMSYGDLLNGARTDFGEEMLVLRPLKQPISAWSESLPGEISMLAEIAYLDLQMLDDQALKNLITKTATEEFFRTQYRNKTQFEWQGPNQTEPDWQTAFLNKYKELPDWPILVKGGDQIGFTKTNPDLLPGQRLSLFLKVGMKWFEHRNEVENFFNYYQRRLNICGHPLAAVLLGRSVKSSTIDVLPFQEFTAEESFYPVMRIQRNKASLIQDFRKYVSLPDPTYHPLALDPDQSPHRLIIRRKPPAEAIPVYLRPSLLQVNAWKTKLSIQNPFELPVQINCSLSEGVNISPVNFNLMIQTVEFEANENLSSNLTEGRIEVISEDGAANYSVAQELMLSFMDFHAIPIKFFKLIENQQIHSTDMDEGKLHEVIAYANEILSSQTNVYIYPVEELVNEVSKIVHETKISAGVSPLSASLISIYSELFFVEYKQEYHDYINVIFVWDQAATGKNSGVTDYPYDSKLALIYLDTLHTDQNLEVHEIADTLVHELGHWFAHTFSRVPNLDNPRSSDCDLLLNISTTMGKIMKDVLVETGVTIRI